MGIKIQNNDIDQFAGWTYTWDVVNQQWSVARASVQHLVPERVYLGSNLVYNAMDVSGRPAPNYGAGIYHNVNDGIISLSTDGTTWYTIADKNLGASEVYYNGTITAEEACGKLYQRGNNYGFNGRMAKTVERVDASSYGPNKYTGYYSDDTFITGDANVDDGDWSSVQNDDLWGDVTNTNAARQGPCPDGFHIPSLSEWNGIITIMNGLGLTTGTNWKVNLHMPFAGYRDSSNAIVIGGGRYGYYRATSPGDSYNPRRASCLNLLNKYVFTDNYYHRSFGHIIRALKNEFVVPTSSWTVIQGTLGSAGIFWNQTDGLISITGDGSTGYTMMDKNLGATTVYSDGDTLTQDNMGNMYQWGNNYGFPSTGTLTDISSTQVDASGYGPVECTGYYSMNMFINTSNDWSSVQNNNLWGNTTDINVARQGPCPKGFHVPSSADWTGLYHIMRDGLSITTGDNRRMKLHMPFAGYLYEATGTISDKGTECYYWSSSPGSTTYSIYIDISSSGAYIVDGRTRSNGHSIRPFKNEFVAPTSSWTVIEGTLGGAGIFWDQANGLISITGDGSTGYTIMDKNLGATIVYSDGDTLSEDNCGKFYQWGNNYGFHWGNATSSTQVDASSYGPGNYYSSSTFITIGSSSGDWCNPKNNDLWGANGTYGDRQGPCPNGFHIPTKNDWNGIITIMNGLSLSSSNDWKNNLYMPYAGFINNIDGSFYDAGYGSYWTSDFTSNSINMLYLSSSSTPSSNYSSGRARGLSIRPFKNTPVIPAQTTDWTIIYQPS